MVTHAGGCHCGRVRSEMEAAIAKLTVRQFDGRHWEEHAGEIAALS